MKSLNHDTRHFSRHDSDDKKMADDKDANALMLLAMLTAKRHKKRTVWVRPTSPLVTRQVSNLLVVHLF